MCSYLNILINDTADLVTLNTQLTALKVMPERSLPNSEISNKGHKNVKSDKKYTTEQKSRALPCSPPADSFWG